MGTEHLDVKEVRYYDGKREKDKYLQYWQDLGHKSCEWNEILSCESSDKVGIDGQM